MGAKVRALALLALLLASGVAFAQSASGGAQTFSDFSFVMRAPDLPLSTAAAAEALPTTIAGTIPTEAWICNQGPDTAYFEFGIATTPPIDQAEGFPLWPGQCGNFDTTGYTWIQGIADSATANLKISLGYGHP